MNVQQMQSRIARLALRQMNFMVRAAVTGTDDTKGLQRAQLTLRDGQVRDNLEVLTPLGISARPEDGAEALVLQLTPGHSVVFWIGDRRYRLKGLAKGDMAIHDTRGNFVKITAAQITVKHTAKVVADTPEFETTGNATIGGDLQVNGSVNATGDVSADGNMDAGGDITAQGEVSDANVTTPTMTAMRAAYNAHVGHAAIGGVTPAGVTPPSPM